MRRLQISSFLLFLLLSAVITQCKPKEKIAPEIIPFNSLFPELGYFEQTAVENSNFFKAKNEVQKWNPILNDSLEFYKKVYSLISEKNFEYQTDNQWLISFDDNLDTDDNYSLKFFEIVDADTIYTRLFASKYNSDDTTIYENILLMTGTSINTDTGTWTINLPDTSNTVIEFLSIDWTISEGNNPKVKVTNHLFGTNNGNYISSQDSIDSGYNSYITLFHKVNSNYTSVEWNNQSNIGRLSDYNLFLNENWHCWDETFQDSNCD